MGSRPCPRARERRVAPQAQATAAPDYATGRSHKVRGSTQPRWMTCQTSQRSELGSMTHPSLPQVPPLHAPLAS
eukprot:1866079-Pyramimonas_sp.AAC.1